MKKKSLIIVLSMIALAVITMTACEKTNNIETADLITAEDDAIADLAYDDVFAEVDGIMNLLDLFSYEVSALKSGGTGNGPGNDTCPVISVIGPEQGGFWPRTVIVDYGQGCQFGHNYRNRNRIRQGKIKIDVSGPMWLEGSSRVVTMEGFYVNDHKVDGTRTVTNEGRHEDGEYAGKIFFSVELEGGMVTTPEGEVITRSMHRTRTFVEGEETKWDTRDDIWYIEGVATGLNRRGIEFTREITSPLWKEIGCRFITQGTVLISSEGRPDVILDYGDGECDPIATVTVDEESREINLKRW